MLFSSLTFLFVFFPLTLLLYYIAPKNFRNGILLLMSFLFFAWGGISYTIIFILSIVFNFVFALRINHSKRRKTWLTIGLIFNISLLVLFKYLNFFIENINGINGLISSSADQLLPSLKIVLPLGISFYTFHQMSMLVDIYRRPDPIKLRFAECALYVAFFPQLIAGPIVRYKDIIHQIRSRKETISLFSEGVERFIIGLFKKVVLANTCAGICDSILETDFDLLSTSAAWAGIIAYSLQIYFDFSGYSDMAIGLAKMFGFNLLENFNFPYLAKSIQDFWRRWHISLSTWFRDYVYIPLGGNRISNRRTYINLIIVFLLTGFWHGATWSFVFWGIFHGTFIILERLWLGKVLEKVPGIISWVYTILIVIIGWVFFRIEHFDEALEYTGRLFGFYESGPIGAIYFFNYESLVIFLLAIVVSLRFFNVGEFINVKSEKLVPFKQLSLLAVFLYSILILNSGSYNPFIYFQF